MKQAPILLLAVFLTLGSFNFLQAQKKDAKAIVKKADQKFRGESQMAKMSMKIVRPDWTREISMKTWSLGKKYSLTLITAPAKEKGQVFLKRKNEIWHWIPDIERMIKLPPSMMMQSWMGSDFNNNDLIRESSIVTDYNHSLISSETINGEPCHKIEMTPKPDAPVVWSKVITWIHKEENYQLKSKFYGENGDLVDVIKFSNVREVDNRRIPTKLTMIPKDKEDHKTILNYENIDYGVNVEPGFFSKQNMRKLSR